MGTEYRRRLPAADAVAFARAAGQRARAARAYLSGLHEDEPRRGAGLVGRPPGQYPGLGALDLQQAKEPPVSCESAGSAARG